MIRCYYLGGQRIDPVRPVVRWLIDVWTAFYFVRENIIAKCGRTPRLRRRTMAPMC